MKILTLLDTAAHILVVGLFVAGLVSIARGCPWHGLFFAAAFAVAVVLSVLAGDLR